MVLLVVLALAIGISLGLLGGGGSILTVPLLVYVVGLEPRPAIATSLLVVGASSAAAMAVHARAGRVRWRVGISFGAASMVGAFVGGRLAHRLPERALLAAFTGVMIVTAVMMLRPRAATATAPAVRFSRAALIGVCVGMLTGVVGAGGGFVVVPALAMLCGLAMKEAIATSLLVIAMNSFAGFAGHVADVHVDARLAAVLVAASVTGSVGGALLGGRVRPEALRRAFAMLVLAMAAFMAYRQWPGAARVVPVPALLGGALIGASASMLLVLDGRVAGVSGILGGLVRPRATDVRWRVMFVGGLLAGGLVLRVARPESFGTTAVSLPSTIAAGLLVGFGTRLGGGCTSGHGVCGTSRGSPRSFAATITFMVAGGAAAFFVRHVLGGSP